MLKEMQHGNFGSGSSQIAYLFEVTTALDCAKNGLD